MRQGQLSFKARGTRSAPFVTKMAAMVAIFVIQGCSTMNGVDKSEPVTGESARDVNWTFADAAAMEKKVAGLKAENARLSRRVMELEREVASGSGTETVSAENAPGLLVAPPLKETASLDVAPARSSQPSNPVIEAPNETRIATLPDAPVPVEPAPRLVQPTFASTEQTFENEAPAVTGTGDMELSSVLWGVHLASYRRPAEASEGWRKLQRENPDELGLLEPRIERINIEGRGEFLRLIGGGFADQDTAKTLCQNLEVKGLYCQVSGFGGERLSLAETQQG